MAALGGSPVEERLEVWKFRAKLLPKTAVTDAVKGPKRVGRRNAHQATKFWPRRRVQSERPVAVNELCDAKCGP